MGKLGVYRDTTAHCKERIRLGLFDDGYHACLFARALLADAWEDGLQGALVIAYDFSDENEEEDASDNRYVGCCGTCEFQNKQQGVCGNVDSDKLADEVTDEDGCSDWRKRK